MDNIKELVKAYCEDEGLYYREDYLGRGMREKTCVAITCDDPLYVLSGLFAFLVDNGKRGKDVYCALGAPKQDNMGMSRVLYFPNLLT